jgi:DNA invertase Pin-like site-specific DNA recombinase
MAGIASFPFAKKKEYVMDVLDKTSFRLTAVQPDGYQVRDQLGVFRDTATPFMRKMIAMQLNAVAVAERDVIRAILRDHVKTEAQLVDFIRYHLRMMKNAKTPDWDTIFAWARGREARTIANRVTRAFLSPYTQLGKRRLQREFEKLSRGG